MFPAQLISQTLALLVVGLLAAWPLRAAEIEVVHWWTSASERAAVAVFADAFDASGADTWRDAAIAGGPNARAAVLQRMLGGDPPHAAQFNAANQFDELIEAGMVLDLTELARSDGWYETVRPRQLLDACERDGRLYCVPVNIHSWQWAWVSPVVFEQAQVPLPATIDEFIAAAPAIEAAGFVPLAIGRDAWHRAGLFGVLAVNALGAERYTRLYAGKDPDIAGSPDVTDVLRTFRKLSRLVDAGSATRNWNDATRLVIQHKAGMQIMGDWARGEFVLAGKQPGRDYACIPGPSERPYISLGGDVFMFPRQSDAAIEAAQLRLAATLMDADVQRRFNLAKGSLPVRADIDLSLADACMRAGLALLEDARNVVGDPFRLAGPTTHGALQDLLGEFGADASLSVEAAKSRLVYVMARARAERR